MKQGTANLAEDYCFIHKALRPVGTAANCRGAAVKFEAWKHGRNDAGLALEVWKK